MRQTATRQKQTARRRARALEWLLWICALACLLPYVATWAARDYLGTVAAKHAAAPADAPPRTRGDQAVGAKQIPTLLSDRTLWSSQRISAFEKLNAAFSPDIVATLQVPSQASQIPVFAGVNETNMTLGAAHLLDSAPLDSEGNIALTAHRDGSFRMLKDIEPGEQLVLDHGDGRKVYEVMRSEIVSPDRVDVLDPTPVPTLTLITCHPFYFVGSAPNRFVLQAELRASQHEEESSFAERSPDPSIERSSFHSPEKEE